MCWRWTVRVGRVRNVCGFLFFLFQRRVKQRFGAVTKCHGFKGDRKEGWEIERGGRRGLRNR